MGQCTLVVGVAAGVLEGDGLVVGAVLAVAGSQVSLAPWVDRCGEEWRGWWGAEAWREMRCARSAASTQTGGDCQMLLRSWRNLYVEVLRNIAPIADWLETCKHAQN